MFKRQAFFISFLVTHLCFTHSVAQEQPVLRKIRETRRGFQVSLFPGISTNGVASGSFYNQYAINIFGGLSAGNRVFELGGITNINLKTSTGIQIAGLANVVGANAFINLSLWEERALINTEKFETNFTGIQFAGFLNYVRTHAKGIQLAGVMNVVQGNASGFQLSGIGNSAAGSVSGIQIAGLYNVATESMNGFQVSALFNYTAGALAGAQIGLINKSLYIFGHHSTPPTRARGLQIGLINFSRNMDGTQIGLINFGGAMRGKQFGLINFFEKMGSKEIVRMGTPVGLLNFGAVALRLRGYFTELYPYNFEYISGNTLNGSWTQSGMPFHDRNLIRNRNAIIFAFDPGNDTWAFGYGFRKELYNKVSMLPIPANEKRMMDYGVAFTHLNPQWQIENRFNVVTRFHFDWGRRYRYGYWYIGASLNYFLYEPKAEPVYTRRSVSILAPAPGNLAARFWPGYSVGLQL